jgi:lysozyme family protein
MPGNDDERSLPTAAFGRLFSWRNLMPPTPEQTELGYHRMWDRAQIKPDKIAPARKITRAIITNRAAYAAVERSTGVPWFMIGALHCRESDMNFATHLHNGDSLKRRTYHVPAGRPKQGSPPFQWYESAIDALTMAPHALDKVKAWPVERILYESEKYNGWGYLTRGNSPYLWSWTSEYHGGKYVADGVYDPRHWDEQPGCVALLKQLAALEPAVAARLTQRAATPPQEVHDRATKRERLARAGGVASGATGGGSETAKAVMTQPEAALLPPLAAYSLIGVGVAVVLVATALIVRKRAAILAKWAGAAPVARS